MSNIWDKESLISLCFFFFLHCVPVLSAGTVSVEDSDVRTSVDATFPAETDSTRNILIDEIVVSGDPKNTLGLDMQPVSYTAMKSGQIESLGVQSLKDASLFVPNLFMPDYGSRLTGAIYVRGVGSRINTPAVGLYVNDVACVDKSAFDFSFLGIDKIEVLRGPQSTLYGRNAMGGLIKIYTKDPRSAGTDLKIGGATKDGSRYAQFLTSNAVNEDASFSLGGFYTASDGYNRNTFLNRRSNGSETGGGMFRWLYSPLENSGLKIDFCTSFEYSDEDGYDYYYTGYGDDENYTPYIGKIMEGELGGYYRNLLNTSLKVESAQTHFILTSVTSYQFLSDRMFMDQDFSPLSIFTLEQRQRSHSVAEELTFKSRNAKRIDWTSGLYVSHQSLHTSAPVRFGMDGIQSLIQDNIDRGFAAANAAMQPMGMALSLDVDNKDMTVDGTFETPVFNSAVFGQLTFKNLCVEGLDLTAGVRLDYEHTKMKYDSGANTAFTFLMTRGGQPMYNYQLDTESRYLGSIRKDYLQFLPKVSLTYRFDDHNLVYASVSKGFRSGGYNIQMFSDLIQTALQNDMMRTLSEKMPMMNNFVNIADNPSADSTTVFKPEVSWNYELGAHWTMFGGILSADAALFLVETHNQQVARYAESGLGRQMVNAGRSLSYGMDVSLASLINIGKSSLRLQASYGYTHAKFRDYDGGTYKGESFVYDGNYVPFAPLHTCSMVADWLIPFNGNAVRSLSVGANVTGTGRVYWTEKNDVSQPFYMLLGAHIAADFGLFEVNIWGKNLTRTKYVPFYFESMSKGFAQTARPLQLGVDVSVRF
ncbi:MAG: TonB-dependent receptor [Roseburia sp.]|nr:TonB-dependent receptor [Roseburia sp.]